ncbi:SpoIIE family protein phosphatase [Spongiactinospora sp. 9N601]|uniref:SpoIIE family protein phosphatase n=1 Tax=Spongiactinospora sp. 9N601 TaxID=3375149 RepID=UPI00379F5FEC
MPERAGPAMGDLLTASHLATLEDLPRLLTVYGVTAALFDPAIYVADLQQQYLVPIPGQVDSRDMDLVPVRVDTTPPGRAFRDADIVEVDPPRGLPEGMAGGRRLWVPMLDGTERVGVVGLTVPVADVADLRRAFWVASLVAILVVSKRDTSDTYADLVRMRPMGLSAEVLWNLLPAGTFANEYVVVAAALEPAYEVGSDAYDYGISGDRLLVYTDGVIEAQSPAGEQFGIDRFIDYIIRHEAAGLSAPETLRRLIQTILNYQEGHLQDDATVLLVEWRTDRHGQLVPRASR